MAKEIIWNAPLYDPSGYAACAREYVFALNRLGVNVKIQPISFWSSLRGALDEDKLELLQELEHTDVSRYAPKVQHTVPDVYKKDKDFNARKLNIGYTVFETDKIPPKWLPKMNMMDKIFVPCTFNLKTFVRGGFDKNKMRVIPHIADTDKWDPNNYEPFPIDDNHKKDFYFLTIMDVTPRKGWDILLRAYLREFAGDKNVGLIFKGYFGGVSQTHQRNLIRRLKSFKDSLGIKNPPDIIFYGDILTEYNLIRLYKLANAYVLPMKGSGFELTALEGIMMELPTIVTNWGGHLDFATDKTAFLIDVLKYEYTDDEMIKITPNYKGQRWAIPSEAHLRHQMRYVYEHYKDAKQKAKYGREFVKKHFNWKIIGEKIIKEI